jgi:hypothetical protein
MPCIKSVLFTALQLSTTFFSSSPASSDTDTLSSLSYNVPPERAVAFEKQLKSLSESSINAALHANLPQLFKEGMFERDSSALEAVYRTNPPLATQLLVAARYELLRRQAGPLGLNNTTSITSTPVVTSSTTTKTSQTTQDAPPTTTSSNHAVIIPIVVSSTNSAGSVQATTIPVLASASTSVPVTLTSTNSAGALVFVTTSLPAVLTTDSAGQVTTSPAPTLNSNGAIVLTTTNAAGSTFVTTITPTGGVVSSEVVITETLPNGAKSTFTSFAVVPTAATESGSPKLQGSGMREKPRLGLVGMVVFGVLLGGMFL